MSHFKHDRSTQQALENLDREWVRRNWLEVLGILVFAVGIVSCGLAVNWLGERSRSASERCFDAVLHRRIEAVREYLGTRDLPKLKAELERVQIETEVCRVLHRVPGGVQ